MATNNVYRLMSTVFCLKFIAYCLMATSYCILSSCHYYYSHLVADHYKDVCSFLFVLMVSYVPQGWRHDHRPSKGNGHVNNFANTIALVIAIT